MTRTQKLHSGNIQHTHVFERDEPVVDGVPGGPLAAGEDVAHARLVRLVLAHAAREAVAGDACNHGKGTKRENMHYLAIGANCSCFSDG